MATQVNIGNVLWLFLEFQKPCTAVLSDSDSCSRTQASINFLPRLLEVVMTVLAPLVL